MRWWRTAVFVFGLALAGMTVASWLVTTQDLRDWLIRGAARPGLAQVYRVYQAVVWRDTVRYLGPVCVLVLLAMRLRAEWTATLARRVAHDVRRLGARWGRVWVTMLLVALLAAPVCFVIGVSHVVDDGRTYARVRCPPDVIMTSQVEQRLIEAVRQRTPQTARMLLVTDEEPWFLNYYLYPRVLFQLDDEWDGPRNMAPGWLHTKRIDWVLVRMRGQRARLVRRSEYSP